MGANGSSIPLYSNYSSLTAWRATLSKLIPVWVIDADDGCVICDINFLLTALARSDQSVESEEMTFLGKTWTFMLKYKNPDTIKLSLNLIDDLPIIGVVALEVNVKYVNDTIQEEPFSQGVFARFTTTVKSVELLEVDLSRNGGRERNNDHRIHIDIDLFFKAGLDNVPLPVGEDGPREEDDLILVLDKEQQLGTMKKLFISHSDHWKKFFDRYSDQKYVRCPGIDADALILTILLLSGYKVEIKLSTLAPFMSIYDQWGIEAIRIAIVNYIETDSGFSETERLLQSEKLNLPELKDRLLTKLRDCIVCSETVKAHSLFSSLSPALQSEIKTICDEFLEEFRRLDTKMKITHEKCPVCESEEEVVMLYLIYRVDKSEQRESPTGNSE